MNNWARESWRWTLAVAVVAAGGCSQVDEPERTATAVGPVQRVEATTTVPMRPAVPDGLAGTIVFHSDREGRSKLFTLDLRTGVVTPLTTGADHHDVEPSWSPDGAWVAFVSTRFDSRTYDLAVTDARGTAVRRLTTHLAFERQPTWSPDGQAVLFSSEQEGTQAVFRLGLDTGSITRLSPLPERALMPAAARDGSRLAYVMGGADGLQIVLHDLQAGTTRPLTRGPENAAWPAWSPDGSRLVHTRLQPQGSHLELLDVATGAVTALLVDGLAEVREPSWSPDGRFLVASGSVDAAPRADWNLVLLAPDPPAAAVLLTSGSGNDGAPSWAPR